MKNTTEGNKLIAEFMGYIDNGDPDGFLINPATNYDEHISELNYHFDWNLLMAVVEKIESCENEVMVKISAGYCIIDDINGNEIEFESDTKIGAVYGACVEFIEWYNKNKTT